MQHSEFKLQRVQYKIKHAWRAFNSNNKQTFRQNTLHPDEKIFSHPTHNLLQGEVHVDYPSNTHPTFHLTRKSLEFLTITRSSTRTFLFSIVHVFLEINNGNTSLEYLFQKESTILCTSSTSSTEGVVGTWADALPRSVSFGHRYDPSSESFGIRPIGC